MLFHSLYPSHFSCSAYEIDFEKLASCGVKGVLFDVDNTLVPHGAPADERAVNLFNRLTELGISYCFISNNKEPRVKYFAGVVGGTYVYKAGKPSKKSYLQGMTQMGTNLSTTVFVGDQLLTDIWGANRAGVESYLVKPIDKKEEIQIVLKRYLEKIIIGIWRFGGRVAYD